MQFIVAKCTAIQKCNAIKLNTNQLYVVYMFLTELLYFHKNFPEGL